MEKEKILNVFIIIDVFLVLILTILFISLRINNIINYFSDYITVLISLFLTHIISIFVILFVKHNNEFNKRKLYFNYALYCVCLCISLLVVLGFLFTSTTIDFVRGI